MSTIKPIRSTEDQIRAEERVKELWFAEPGTPEHDEREVLVSLIVEYEHRTDPATGNLDPIDTLKQFLDIKGLRQKDLIPYIGSESRVSEVLNRKRPLTLEMVRKLHNGLGIDPRLFTGEPKSKAG